MTDTVSLKIDNAVATISMNDNVNKNVFTPELTIGLQNAIDRINSDQTVKVAIIHGIGNYFCCGASKDHLYEEAHRKAKFDDFNFHMLMSCRVPMISAMQGHALGGGLIFGLYADMIILAEEFFYNCNFMKYGFTPGVGTTFILPYKFGSIIAREMMFSARNFLGKELRERGISAKVVTEKQVIPTAKQLANKIAETDREACILLKEHLNRDIEERLPKYVEGELEMHDITFQRPDVIAKIDELFKSPSW